MRRGALRDERSSPHLPARYCPVDRRRVHGTASNVVVIARVAALGFSAARSALAILKGVMLIIYVVFAAATPRRSKSLISRRRASDRRVVIVDLTCDRPPSAWC